jgi:hypothetical protein
LIDMDAMRESGEGISSLFPDPVLLSSTGQ